MQVFFPNQSTSKRMEMDKGDVPEVQQHTRHKAREHKRRFEQHSLCGKVRKWTILGSTGGVWSGTARRHSCCSDMMSTEQDPTLLAFPPPQFPISLSTLLRIETLTVHLNSILYPQNLLSNCWMEICTGTSLSPLFDTSTSVISMTNVWWE